METFLEQLAGDVIERFGQRMPETAVVFPGRRAVVFFREALRRRGINGGEAPEIFSFEEFLAVIGRVNLPDKMSLAFELFPLHHRYFPDEPFEKFYTWASVLLSDFEEVDASLADAKKLFSNLYELKRIDTTIDSWLNEDGKPSELQQRYLTFWEHMGALYFELREKLKAKNMAWPGMAMREAAEQIGSKASALPWLKVLFCGFNALTPAEEKLIFTLVDMNKADVYWDMDSWYVYRKEQEAGKFFREIQSRRKETEVKWVGDALLKQEKYVRATGVPGRVGMAKMAGVRIREMLASGIAPEDIAIVLPEESLLFPVLHALPEEVKEINVTMGLPLRHTPLFSLVEAILVMHENAEQNEEESGKPLYYFRDVQSVLRHPYIHAILFQDSRDLETELRMKNYVYVRPSYFEKYNEDHLFRFLFRLWNDVPDGAEFFLDLFRRLRNALHGQDKSKKERNALELEYLLRFYTLAQRVRDRLDAYRDTATLDIFRKLFREVVYSDSIPFSGEPLKGLQVLGFLETRLLDFKHVMVLSMNEGIAPPVSTGTSFMPYSVRRAFSIPTYEEKDAIFAYHFSRMIQRASTVSLFYNTEPGNFGGGEESRFITQMRIEMAKHSNAESAVTFEDTIQTFPVTGQQPPEITVPKTEESIARITQIGTEQGFSPSALGVYLNCSLQFYFRHILDLKDRRELEENLQANTMGEITHNALEELFRPYVGQWIQPLQFDVILERVEETVNEEFKKLSPMQSPRYGKNRLAVGVIADLIRNLLLREKESAPLFIEMLEEEVSIMVDMGRFTWKLSGRIDRVDRDREGTRIIDYKTGQVENTDLKKVADIREGKKKREAFQLAVYSWLYLASGKGKGPVRSGIYALRSLSEGMRYLTLGPGGLDTFRLADFSELESEIRALFSEIADPGIPFTQTDNRDICDICDYRKICGRM